LLTLFVEVAALEAEGAGNVGHVEIVAADFGEEDFALESFGTLDESSLLGGGFAGGGGIHRGGVRSGQGQANIFRANSVFGGEEGEAFDDIAQFADITGPGITAQLRDGFVGERFFFPTVLFGYLAGKMDDELGKILEAIAQWRKGQRENIDTMKEVAAEFVIFDAVFEIAVSGNNDADIDLYGFVAADAFDFAFLKHAEKFGLHGNGHIADLVEEESTALGLLEFSDVASRGAGERTFFVPEELGLDQFCGDSRAIESDEGAFVARGFLVNGARDQFFSGAGFAEDADAGFAGGDAVNLREELLHGGAGADEFVFTETMAEFTIFVFEAGEAEGVFYGDEKFVGGERLFEKIESAEAGGFDGHFDIGLAGNENNGSLDTGFFQFFEEFEAGFAGHDDVGKNEIEMLGTNEFGGAKGAIADGGFVSGETKGAGE
jgi:hypothetical protein